jgi:hypothetical protein
MGLACQWSGTVERRVSGMFINAFKGDSILSPGAGSPMALLYQHMTPPQTHSHGGLMTRNFDEIAHAFGSGDWLAAEVVRTLNTTPLRFGWPGSIAQHAENAVEGELVFDPRMQPFEISAIHTGTRGTPFPDGSFRITPPLVLKPDPLLETAALRTTLRAAAELARGRCLVPPGGLVSQSRDHFSFFTFTDGAHATPAPDPDGSGAWPAGTLPAACSTFVWRSLRDAGVVFERAQGDPTTLEIGDLEPRDTGPEVTAPGSSTTIGGAEIVPGGVDGLYRYSPEERVAAGEALKAHLVHAAGEAHGLLGGFAALVANVGANVPLNVIASDSLSDGDEWRETGPGETVSPDDMLFWDPPTVDGTGVYGFTERLVYRTPRTETVDVYTWTAFTNRGTVTIRALLDDQPVAGAQVLFASSTPRTTDAQGRVTVEEVPFGVHPLQITSQAGGGSEHLSHVTVDADENVDAVLRRRINEQVRVVSVLLTFVGTDDEWPGGNEIEIDVRSDEFDLGPGELSTRTFLPDDRGGFLKFGWGGELRAEYTLRLSVEPDFGVTAIVEGQLFEGDTETTTDLDDEAEEQMFVPASTDGTPTGGLMAVEMATDLGDSAQLFVTLSHRPHPGG